MMMMMMATMTHVVVLALLLIMMTTSAQQVQPIDTWKSVLSTQLKSLRDSVMKVNLVAGLFANTTYAEVALDADALAAQLEARLVAVLKAKERIVATLAQKVESAWSASKDLAESTSCQWNDASSRLVGLRPNPIYNDSVTHDFSAVKLARDAEPSGRDICFSEALDRTFIENDPQKNLPWQYFGSNTGYHRQYPASFRGSDYDPRSRPWYTGASSGPKDVLLILDVSGSMGEANRLALMKDAATTVLKSLTVNDYVNVVTFSTDANTFECMANTMLPADPGTLDYLIERVNALRASGATDFYKAFTLGFDVLDRSKRAGATTGCDASRTILFLTDGVPSNTADHLELIAERNRQSNVTIFTYALGASARVQDTIACQHNGAYTFIQGRRQPAHQNAELLQGVWCHGEPRNVLDRALPRRLGPRHDGHRRAADLRLVARVSRAARRRRPRHSALRLHRARLDVQLGPLVRVSRRPPRQRHLAPAHVDQHQSKRRANLPGHHCAREQQLDRILVQSAHAAALGPGRQGEADRRARADARRLVRWRHV
jgi:uncharacterized protein YegL